MGNSQRDSGGCILHSEVFVDYTLILVWRISTTGPQCREVGSMVTRAGRSKMMRVFDLFFYRDSTVGSRFVSLIPVP